MQQNLDQKFDFGFPHLNNQCSLNLHSISQEHGIIKVSPEYYDSLEVGNLIGILPVHSCMTADLMKCYKTTDGKDITMMVNL